MSRVTHLTAFYISMLALVVLNRKIGPICSCVCIHAFANGTTYPLILLIIFPEKKLVLNPLRSLFAAKAHTDCLKVNMACIDWYEFLPLMQTNADILLLQ